MKTCLTYNVISQTESLFWTNPSNEKKKLIKGDFFVKLLLSPKTYLILIM